MRIGQTGGKKKGDDHDRGARRARKSKSNQPKQHQAGRLYSSSVRGDICALSSSDEVLAPLAVW